MLLLSSLKGRYCLREVNTFRAKIISSLEDFFEAYGLAAAKRPWAFILGGVMICGLCSVGLHWMQKEVDHLDLWVPQDSAYRSNSKWLTEEFQTADRLHAILVHTEKGGNVLTADSVRDIYRLRKTIGRIKTLNGYSWKSQCLAKKIAVHAEEQLTAPPSFPDEVCQVLKDTEETAPETCTESHILEIWARDGQFAAESDALIANLTDQNVIDAINRKPFPVSGLTGAPVFVSAMLGKTRQDEEGDIRSAESMILTLVGEKILEKGKGVEHADDATLEFEQSLIDTILEFQFHTKLTAVPNVSRSFSDAISKQVDSDLTLLGCGFLIVITYVMIMSGRFNSLQHRFWLTFAGMASVGMGIAASFGLSSAIGLIFTTMHLLLPFLMLGIGIDDMFVIMQSFDNKLRDEQKTNIYEYEELFAIGLRHAGVAITITSVTDLLAFGIGATTVLPALSSFCLYAAIGITFVFIFMLTFFLGFFAYDVRRMLDSRDACLCCLKKNHDYAPSQCSQKSLLRSAFRAYGNVLTKFQVKVVVLIFSCGLLAFGVWGLTQLETRFDFKWFINEGTYVRDFLDKKDEYFPSTGIKGTVYIADVPKFNEKMSTVKRMGEEFAAMDILVDGLSSKEGFYVAFEDFIDGKLANDSLFPENEVLEEQEFRRYLGEFLFTVGPHYQKAVHFKGNLTCQEETPPLRMISFQYRHKRYPYQRGTS